MERVCFGIFPQNLHDAPDGSPIEWLILKQQDGRALLLSEKILSAAAYNSGIEKADEPWAASSIRNWLNNDFLNLAFSDEEQTAICETLVVTPDRSGIHGSGGPDSEDKVFLLDVKELCGLFTCELERIAESTPYAVQRGHKFSDSGWWLRSPSDSAPYAAYVNGDGQVHGFMKLFSGCGVRPVLVVDLSVIQNVNKR